MVSCSVCLFILRLITKYLWARSESIEGRKEKISWVEIFHFLFSFNLSTFQIRKHVEYFFSFSIYSFAEIALCRSKNETRFEKKCCLSDLNALKLVFVAERNLNAVIKWPKIFVSFFFFSTEKKTESFSFN